MFERRYWYRRAVQASFVAALIAAGIAAGYLLRGSPQIGALVFMVISGAAAITATVFSVHTRRMVLAANATLQPSNSTDAAALKLADNHVIIKAEEMCRGGGTFHEVLPLLRNLSMDRFGELFWSMPDRRFPCLSGVLPSYPPEDVQRTYTGTSSEQNLQRSLNFVRAVEKNYLKHCDRYLQTARVLDFGVGFGRMVRLFYRYVDPNRIWGVDPMQKSLDLLNQHRVLGTFSLSDREPTSLLPRKVDLAYAFSVFTHLPPDVATKCLAALRECIDDDGILFVTIRPVEFWARFVTARDTNVAAKMERQHRENGHAYLPQDSADGKFYGTASYDPAFFNREGWRVVGQETSPTDFYQPVLMLKPR